MYNFDPYNVLLAIATNIPQRLNTGLVLQGHVRASKHSTDEHRKHEHACQSEAETEPTCRVSHYIPHATPYNTHNHTQHCSTVHDCPLHMSLHSIPHVYVISMYSTVSLKTTYPAYLRSDGLIYTIHCE